MQSTAYTTTAPGAVALLEGDALYGRTSSEDQAEDGTIGAQQDFLRQYAKLYRLRGAREYWDDGVSGTVPLAERPHGARLLTDIRAGLVKRVHFTKVNRLGRSLPVLMDAHAVLDALGATIKSATEPFDTREPMGRFIFQLLASMAELDRSLLLDSLTQGRDRVAREGRWTGGPLPYGFDVPPLAPAVTDGGASAASHGAERSGGRRRKNTSRPLIRSTVLVPEAGEHWTEADVIHDVHVRLAGGSSVVAECGRLNALGVPGGRKYPDGPRRRGPWTPAGLRRMIHSEIYVGQRVLKSKRGTIVHAVPPLVPPELRAAALAQLVANRTLPKTNARRRYLLRGLVKCACEGCGGTYVGGRGGGPRDRETTAYYRCSGSIAAHNPDEATRCRSKAQPALWLEREVWAKCIDLSRHPAQALAELEAILRARLGNAAGREADRGGLQRALAANGQQRERVLDSYRVGRTTAAETDRDLAKVAADATELRRRLDALDADRDVAATMAAKLTEAEAVLAELAVRADELEDLETGDDTGRWEAQRRFTAGLVKAVRVTTLPRTAGRRAEAETEVEYCLERRVRLADGSTHESAGDVPTALPAALCSTSDAPPVLVRRLTPAGAREGDPRRLARTLQVVPRDSSGHPLPR